MKEQLAALYDMQSLDVRIAKIRATLAGTTASGTLRAQIDATKVKLAALEDNLQKLRTKLKDNELNLKSIDEKRAKCEKRLYDGSISNPKELSAVEKEIASLKSQQSDLDGQVLELYETVETAAARTEKLREVIAKAEKQLTNLSAKESNAHAHLEKELAELETQRAGALSKISDKSLISRYEAVRKKTGNTGIAKVTDGRCEGCHLNVSGFTMRNLFAGKTLEICENCGRILYMDITQQ